jgi:multiubiquitin
MGEKEHEKKFHFFVDGTRFDTDEESITGAEIKRLAGIDPTYQVFLEEEGDTPDKQISDAEAVNLGGRIKHFFAVPPATFGFR